MFCLQAEDLQNVSEFQEASFLLLTNKYPGISTFELIDVLDNNKIPSENLQRVLDQLTQMAQAENWDMEYKNYLSLRKSLRKRTWTIWTVPTGMVVGSVFVAMIPDISWFTKILVASAVGIDFYFSYLPEILQRPDADIVQLKKHIAGTLLLAKIQYRSLGKNEGFPWPFAYKRSCELSLEDTLSKLKLK